MSSSKRILLIGVGAVGTTIGGWLAPHCDDLYVLDQGEVLDIISQKGLTTYLQNHKNKSETYAVNTIEKLSDIETPDYIIICVKNYSLEKLSKVVFKAYGDKPVIVAFQNGMENQKILPKYFSKVIYGVVCYNAWLDSSGVAGYQKRGPLVIGTLDNDLQEELECLRGILNEGVETVTTLHIEDAAVSKMIINLTNSLTTLIGFTFKKVSNESLFQKILTGLTYEGVKIARAAGYKECKLGGMPSWKLIRFSQHAPQWLTRKPFKKNVSKMVISSMAQDVIQNGQSQSELETINGTFLELAKKYRVNAPLNEAIYRVCQEEFPRRDFMPLDIEKLWKRICTLK